MHSIFNPPSNNCNIMFFYYLSPTMLVHSILMLYKIFINKKPSTNSTILQNSFLHHILLHLPEISYNLATFLITHLFSFNTTLLSTFNTFPFIWHTLTTSHTLLIYIFQTISCKPPLTPINLPRHIRVFYTINHLLH